MKVPMQWISSYAPINCSPEEYQSKMVMIGNGVEGYEETGSEVSGVVVGKVLTCVPHPDSDHLHVTTVDIGESEPLNIVCGAPNCRAGILTPVAKIGAHLPGGVKIKKGKIRGIASEGMLCSSEELGVPTELYPSIGAAGILEFHENYPLGSDVKPILGIDDTVMDFEVLANRPDCLSVWGISRESAVACGTKFTKPEITVKTCGGDIHDYVKVDVLNSELCPRYVARVIKNVRVGESPMWLRKYLFGAGMRSINNVVDITNFIMLETGHPMHAFNLDMVEGNHIIVREAKEGESITTLDGKEHALTPGQLVICDASKPSCVAGIMGGEESEIRQNTTTVMFECAVFDRAATRITSRNLGIRTESSARFEKGVCVRTAMEAMDRACQMMNELDAGDVVSGVIDIYPNPEPQQVIHASCRRIANRTGVDISPEAIVDILQKLDFQVTRDGDNLTAVVPEYRQDVDGEADLSEEVLRIYGYDKIPGTRLRGETTHGGRSEIMRMRNKISSLLVSQGAFEIMNFSFVSHKSVEKLGLPQDDPRNNMLPIRNPLGEDTAFMQTTLLPNMLQTLALNMNRGNDSARFFEISDVFSATERTDENLPVETKKLVIGVYGKDESFFTLRGMVEELLRHIGIDTEVRAGGDCYYHPGRKAQLIHDGQAVCSLGEIHPSVMERFDLTCRTYTAELDVNQLMSLAAPMGETRSLPKYPAVSRDLSMVMGEETEVGPMLRDMAKAAGSILENADMFDVYRNPVIGLNKKSVAFSFVFRSADHTLGEEEISRAMAKIQKVASEKYGAAIRE